jgi:DNA-binding MarR family transcriptional regulator
VSNDPPGPGQEAFALAMMVARLRRAARRGGEPLPDRLRAVTGGRLPPRHLMLLGLLSQHGEVSVSALADELGASLAVVSSSLSELASLGYVARREDDADRRRTLVSVAEPYRAQVIAVIRAALEPLEGALAALDPAERQALLAALAKINDHLGRDAAEHWPAGQAGLEATGSSGPCAS